MHEILSLDSTPSSVECPITSRRADRHHRRARAQWTP